MTTVELRTSIMADLDKMSVEMLESVSHYVRRLSRRARPSRRAIPASQKREAAMLFVKNLCLVLILYIIAVNILVFLMERI